VRKHAAAIVVIFATLAPAAHAAAPTHRELVKYSALYHAVRHADGPRAPGRNIRRYGVRVHGKVRRATAAEVAKSIRALRALRLPYLAPARPSQSPAGVLTARAASGGLAACIAGRESGGNPSAVSPNGTYRGKYQFDRATWQAAGGTGDPAAASEAEQDKRFAIWYPGHHSAWPVTGPACGG
jgi:hypothetical protein